jgi:ATP-binding cassette subfamily B protein
VIASQTLILGLVVSSNPSSTGFGAEIRFISQQGRQVWRLVPTRHKLGLAGAVAIMAGVSLCNISIAVLLGQIVTTVADSSPYLTAVGILGMMAAAYLFRETFNVARRYLVENTCTRLHCDMSVRVVNHMMKIELTNFFKEKVGTLNGRIYRGVEGFVRFLRILFLDSIPALLTGVFALAFTLVKQPILGVVMMGVIPAAVYLTIRQLVMQKGVRLSLNRSCDEIDGAIVEQLSGIEYVRAANTSAQEIKRLAGATEKRRAMELRYNFQMALFGSAKAVNEGFFHVIVLGVAIFFAITRYLHGDTNPTGDVLTYSVLFLNVMTPLAEIHRVLVEGYESSLRVGDLLEMLAEPLDSSFQQKRDYEPRLNLGAPAIVINNLNVEYMTPQGKRVHALHDLSLTIRHGETIGIVGRSGGGKSTFVRVLLRLLHPGSGEALLGGVRLQDVSREEISKLIGYVGQVPFVFSGTIAENIAYGNDNVTMENIRRVAELAHIDEEIMQMPGRYETLVTERGGNLSGGQRQRLAIARILLKQPPILILDEATSALDNISERVVQHSLGVQSADRTTILVAHRLSTLRDADRILFFKDGSIAEVGSYTELVRKGGLFRELTASAENFANGTYLEPAACAEPMSKSA